MKLLGSHTVSARFHVRVLRLDRTKAEVDLRLTIIHPDQRAFDDTRTFAVLLLLDSLRSGDVASALEDELPRSDGWRVESVQKKERKLVKKVELRDVRNYPLKIDGLDYTASEWATFWQQRELLPQATLSIAAKHAKFLAHLEVGKEWESNPGDVDMA